MKAAFTLFSVLLLALASVALADPVSPAPGVVAQAPTPVSTPTAPPASTVDPSLQKLFSAQKPVNRTTTCYDRVYEDCLSFCPSLSQTNGCGFFTDQQCLCERSSADCPACY